MFEAVRALPRTVWLIGLISLINDSASEMLYPLIPLYLSSVLMAGPRALGIIEGSAEATASQPLPPTPARRALQQCAATNTPGSQEMNIIRTSRMPYNHTQDQRLPYVSFF